MSSTAQPCPPHCSMERAGCRQRDPGAGLTAAQGWAGRLLSSSSLLPVLQQGRAGMRLLKHKKDIKIELTGKLLNRSKLGT